MPFLFLLNDLDLASPYLRKLGQAGARVQGFASMEGEGWHYSQVIADCKQAAEGMIPAEVAKESFISAAIEAHVYAH